MSGTIRCQLVAPPVPPFSVSSDQRAVALLLVLGVAGLAVRIVASPSGPPGAIAYRAGGRAAPSRDSVAARARRLARPLTRGDRIDLDVADAEEIARLPRIGPGLAARIVADRAQHGPFGSLAGLDRVAGIGPTVLAAVRPYAVFSGVPRPLPGREPAHRSRPRQRPNSRSRTTPGAP